MTNKKPQVNYCWILFEGILNMEVYIKLKACHHQSREPSRKVAHVHTVQQIPTVCGYASNPELEVQFSDTYFHTSTSI